MILASLLCGLCCGCMVTSENHSLDVYLESDAPLSMEFPIFPAREPLMKHRWRDISVLKSLLCYTMMFGGDHYEYALVDTEVGSIVYIGAQTPSMDTFDALPEEYMPIAGADEVIYQYVG